MKRTALAVIGVMVLAGISTSAHHSHPNFVLDQNVAIEGDIESVQFKNPHVLIKLRTAAGTIYTAEWQGASWFKNRETENRLTDKRYDNWSYTAVTSNTLKVGDHIVVVGCPARDPALHELVVLKEVRLARNGWIWEAQEWARTRALR